MSGGEKQWLTTGEAARLCSVERDTVLKWIKRGRTPAARTAGGHYRIAVQDVEKLLAPSPRRQPADAARLLGCWDYLAAGGKIRNECRQCLAYQAAAARCFRLRHWPGLDSTQMGCGRKSCEECPYYRQVVGLPTKVLVITGDSGLRQALETADPNVALSFARNAYEAARIVPELWPALVVIDDEVDRGGGLTLLESLLSDPSVVGLRAIYATGSRSRTAAMKQVKGYFSVLAVLKKPFGLTAIREVLEQIRVGTPPGQGENREARSDRNVYRR